MTPDEARRLDERSEIELSVDTRVLNIDAERQLGSSLVGVHWDAQSAEYVVTTTDSKDLAREAFGKHIAVRETPNAIGAEDYTAKTTALKEVAFELLELGVPGWAVDETCGVIEIRILDSAKIGPAQQLVTDRVAITQ